MSKENGGSAFPTNTTNEGNAGACYVDSGMTLRDYFAATALSGFIASRRASHSGEDGAETLAIDAYMVADAMIAERAK